MADISKLMESLKSSIIHLKKI